ncbi:MAG: exodeoxyribonuclease VII large subunit [Rhodospirillales bacterium]|nr:exodeoxyribonuclease VII large subunit [Rhodospirillales bacterium]
MQWADDPAFGANLPVLSVSEISGAVKRSLENAFQRVQVRGEISRPKYHSSGHLYLTLKDDRSVLDAVCWRSRAGKLAFRAEEGLEAIATGRISTYAGGGGSRYQLVIEDLQPAGEGAILKLLEERKRKLAAEGLFDEARKRALPFLPATIGVVTSPSGAVIGDILHRLAERFPRRVLVWPVRVQGEGAAEEIAAAIKGFNALDFKPPGFRASASGGSLPRPDVLIVARGGGALEDLWAFNEESVVRAAAASDIPLIAAIGHETDTTLIDLAADRRAPTPTAAAEMAVPVRAELEDDLAVLGRRLHGGLRRDLAARREGLEGLARGLPEPRRLLETAMQRLDERSERLDQAIAGQLDRLRAAAGEWGTRLPHPRQQASLAGERLAALAQRLARASERRLERSRESYARLDAKRRLSAALVRGLSDRRRALENLGRVLESVSHRKVQERGYVLASGAEGLIVRAAGVKPGAALTLSFLDGDVQAIAAGGEAAPAKKRKPPPEQDGGRQGRLL